MVLLKKHWPERRLFCTVYIEVQLHFVGASYQLVLSDATLTAACIYHVDCKLLKQKTSILEVERQEIPKSSERSSMTPNLTAYSNFHYGGRQDKRKKPIQFNMGISES